MQVTEEFGDLRIFRDFLLQILKKSAKYLVPLISVGRVAQLVEQRTENPCVAGSTPAPPICNTLYYMGLQ